MEATRKEYKRTAFILAMIFLLGITLMLLLMSLANPNPPFPPEVLESVTLDYSGGGSSSSASSENTTTDQSSTNQPDDPAITHDDPDSPVVKPDKPVTTGNSNSGNESNENDNPNPFETNGLFNGNGNGNDPNDTGGAGGGLGPTDGRGNTVGAMGSGRGLRSKPSQDHNQHSGVVMVKIYVKRDGTVDKDRTKVLYDDSRTTSTHQTHYKDAIKLANKFIYDAITGGNKLDTKTIKIEFKVS
jgi:hypothetical protein